MGMKRILLAIAAFALAQPAVAREDVHVNGWLISEVTGKACKATSYFRNRETGNPSHVYISYSAVGKFVTVGFSNSKATSLKSGDKVSLRILMQPLSISENWIGREFHVGVIESGARYFWSEKLPVSTVENFARATAIGFLTGQEKVSAFSLEGSAAAVRELRKCAFEVAGLDHLNVDDPFLK